MVVSVFSVFFAKNRDELDQLVRTTMTNFARASTTLEKHAKQETHIDAMKAMAQASVRQQHGAPSIAQPIAAKANTVIFKNRVKLLSILKTVIFCARQNIALRGHRHIS